MIKRMFVVATLTRPAFHSWPGAPEHRDYLKNKHRHMFHITAQVEVFNKDREIEVHDLIDVVSIAFGAGDKLDQSCEQMALRIVNVLEEQYPDRQVAVTVLEDGEAGSTVTLSNMPQAAAVEIDQPTLKKLIEALNFKNAAETVVQDVSAIADTSTGTKKRVKQ